VCTNTSWKFPITHLYGAADQHVVFASWTTATESFQQRVAINTAATKGFAAYDPTLAAGITVVTLSTTKSITDYEADFRLAISQIGKFHREKNIKKTKNKKQ
jgi:hypothetical protein